MKVGFGCCSVFLLIALMRWLSSSDSESEYSGGSLSVMELFFLFDACFAFCFCAYVCGTALVTYELGTLNAVSGRVVSQSKTLCPALILRHLKHPSL